ncbi:hypothetical protein [Halorubrum saccharovorum]|uniref:hypothetical protein n=1 Tax=Halorubrum saccharovorum TaxID=2248 RepID=UPI000A40B036|nr:hypothetical protein [Halorubrum saccharovorum]
MSDNSFQKPDRDELVADIAEYLVGYIGEGISIKPALDNFTPNINIDGITELLEYYFLLTGVEIPLNKPSRSNYEIKNTPITDIHGSSIGVRDFVSLLKLRSRSLDPETKQKTEIYQGQAPGHIDWNETIKNRCLTGDFRGQTFAVQIQQPTIRSARNKILVELLYTIKNIYTRFDKRIDRNRAPQWFYPWLKEEDRIPIEEIETQSAVGGELEHPGQREREPINLRSIIDTTLSRTQLSNLDRVSISISDAEIHQVRGDRTPLYREAAELLAMYRQLVREDLDEDLAKRLLDSRIIQPPDNDEAVSTLYEMYWILRILDTHNDSKRSLFTMASDENLIAKWKEDDATYLLFNDWDGKYNDKEYLRFDIPTVEDLLPEDDEEGDQSNNSRSEREDLNLRIRNVLSNRYRLETTVFGYNPDKKTPDIVLIKLATNSETPQIERILVGEVKHSTSIEYLRSGIQQLLEYGAFVKVGEDAELVSKSDKPFLANDPSIIGSEEVELGYFVGHKGVIEGNGPDGINILGFEQKPERII